MESHGDESSSSSSRNVVHYGPISVRQCRKSAPTLATGRRSKNLVLVGEEAARRDKRRERNREAARKIKEKRLMIEEELNQKLKDLEDQHSDLQDFLVQLKQRKQTLEIEVNTALIDPIEKLLSNENYDGPLLFFEQFNDDLNVFDQEFDRLLNVDGTINFDSILSD